MMIITIIITVFMTIAIIAITIITIMKETAPGLLVYTLISPPQQGDLFITR